MFSCSEEDEDKDDHPAATSECRYLPWHAEVGFTFDPPGKNESVNIFRSAGLRDCSSCGKIHQTSSVYDPGSRPGLGELRTGMGLWASRR